MRWLALAMVAASLACSAEEAKQAAAKAANEAADKTKQAAKDAADQALAASKDKAIELGDKTKDAAGDLYEDLTTDGQLSKSATDWLTAQAEDGSSVEAVIKKGVQIAPVAIEVAKVANAAVDE